MEGIAQDTKNTTQVKLEDIMDSGISSFRDLRVWQQGIELVKEIYRITKDFPKEEQEGLASGLVVTLEKISCFYVVLNSIGMNQSFGDHLVKQRAFVRTS